MHPTTGPAIPPAGHRATGWDRAAITALGAAGCALSYDALQQMAVAIHIRGPLTYLFPLVIDGFIAYGVRALLVMRTAAFRARLYVWTLFGTATAASIWSNALHAVRLNQHTPPTRLHLDDLTVGTLSTLAPLALAGAVHLHILITRHGHQPQAGPHRRSVHTLLAPNTAVAFGPAPDHPDEEADHADQTADHHPERQSEGPARPDHQKVRRRVGRPPTASLDELVRLVRPLTTAHETPTRAMVRQAIRSAGHRISEDRLTQVMTALRTTPTT
ncbi:DUF2637 domain-containing protein [Streptomyces aidingensis]|uniref:DUF2637 domain-containing protein n=1 Tax=Streptomyces aidingensis TaxID=910347 RepID=A0A1I1UIR8_9ACTN|nr:DUF2637 domain-containing protein [Streptomyces aidingensis]SFD70659.1 Protein of unknown function [Streptomyces aidingensis]